MGPKVDHVVGGARDTAGLRRPHSLREYLDALVELGDVQVWPAEVDLEHEVAAVIRSSYDTRTPAPLFTSFRRRPKGFRVLGAPGAFSTLAGAPFARIALSLGLPPSASGPAIVRALTAARAARPITPVVVNSGPCQENVVARGAVDLTLLPVPLVHEHEQAIDAWGTVVVSTPDGRWTNWSIARVVRLGRDRIIGMPLDRRPLGRICRMWAEFGRPMPFAFVQGAEPAVSLTAGMTLPAGVDGAAFLGALFGGPLQLVRCRTVDLHVPATAEVVVEGHVVADETVPAGLLGEYGGIAASRPLPVCRVSAITHRDDAILPVALTGKPVEETRTARGLLSSAELLHHLRSAGLPIADVWCSSDSGRSQAVVSVTADWHERTALTSERLNRAVAEAAASSRPGKSLSRLLLLDDDVDPADPDEVMWAFTTRSRLHTRPHLAGSMSAYDCLVVLP